MRLTRRSLYHRIPRWAILCAALLMGLGLVLGLGGTVEAGKRARGNEILTIPRGLFIGPVDVGGLTTEQARMQVEAFLEQVGGVRLTMCGTEGSDAIGVTPRALGLYWANPEVLDTALGYGRSGNAVKRYKVLKDLEHQTKTLDLAVSLRNDQVRAWLSENGTRYEQKAVNYELHRENGAFTLTSGQQGVELDMDASCRKIMNTISDGWDFEPAEIRLVIAVQEPKGGREDLEQVKDLLGTFTTRYTNSGSARCANVANGCRLVNDSTVYPGEEFSVLAHITPFTEGNGYQLAGSYQNGQVVDSLGGGICQVSTTLYNAVLRSELKVTERHNHSMIVNYVDPSADAAIAESSGKDFKFVNSSDYPIYIEGYTADKTITFNIYGKETRDPGHKVSFESETLETIKPERDTINANASLPAGQISTQSAHIGYKAQLWRTVTENGVQVSREIVNQSNYKMVPRIVTVGTATADPAVAERLHQAIATGSYGEVKAVADAVRSGGALPAAPEPAPEAAPAPEPAPEPEPEPVEQEWEEGEEEE